MRKVKKTLLTIACAGALVVGSVAATMAYLTDDDAVTNTFTVGNVQIHLDETNVDGNSEYGNCEYCAAAYEADRYHDRDHANRYEGKNKLVPGQKYVKDPTVTVIAGSEESYVKMTVVISKSAALDKVFGPNGANLKAIFPDYDDAHWIYKGNVEDTRADTRTYEFWYVDTVEALDADVELPALFETLAVPGSIDNDQLESIKDMEIKVNAYAIQAASFDSADEAWAA